MFEGGEVKCEEKSVCSRQKVKEEVRNWAESEGALAVTCLAKKYLRTCPSLQERQQE